MKELYKSASIEELKLKFKDVLEGVSPSEIPLAEQGLLKEGISISGILRFCDLHIEPT